MLGRDFTYALLSAVGGVDDSALESALDRLAAADLLIEGAGHEATYRFKHALIQDAAYESLLKSRRQAVHRRAAEVLSDQPERAAAEPEVIAHHFTEAGLDDLAIEWWGRAGDQALRRSAFQEAIAHLGKAIEMADRATAAGVATTKISDTAASQRAKLQTDYAQALMWSKGWSANETKAAWERTDDLATRAERPAERFPALSASVFGVCCVEKSMRLGILPSVFLERRRRRNGSPRSASPTDCLVIAACNSETWPGREAISNWHLKVAKGSAIAR